MTRVPILLLVLIGLAPAVAGEEPAKGGPSALQRMVLAGETAAVRKHLAGVDAVAKNIDVLVRDKRAWTPLHHAAVLDRPEIAEALIDYARRSDLQKGTPLFGKAMTPSLLPRLLEARTRSGATALMLATPRSLRVMEALIAAGADPNATDKAGMTPLHLAVPGEEVNAIERLLKAGADPRQKNAQGFSPRDLCPQSPLEAWLDAASRKNPRSRDVVAISKEWRTFLEAIKTGAIEEARAMTVPRERERMKGDFPRWIRWHMGTISVRGPTAQATAIVEYAAAPGAKSPSMELDATWMRTDTGWVVVQVRRSIHREREGE